MYGRFSGVHRGYLSRSITDFRFAEADVIPFEVEGAMLLHPRYRSVRRAHLLLADLRPPADATNRVCRCRLKARARVTPTIHESRHRQVRSSSATDRRQVEAHT